MDNIIKDLLWLVTQYRQAVGVPFFNKSKNWVAREFPNQKCKECGSDIIRLVAR